MRRTHASARVRNYPPFQLDGLRLVSVSENGAAFNAGLRENDLLVSLNGEVITDINSFIDQVAASAGLGLSVGVKRQQD